MSSILNFQKNSFTDYCEQALQKSHHDFLNVKNNATIFSDIKFLQQYNELSIGLGNLGSLCGLFSQVHPMPEICEISETYEQKLSQLLTDISLSLEIFERFTKVDTQTLDRETQRLVQKTLQDFRRSGVDKSLEVRTKIKTLQEELTLIGQEFSRNIREDVRSIELSSVEDLAGLPQDYIAAHAPGPDGKIKITTDYPDTIPFMRYAKDNHARQALLFEFKNRGYPKNIEVLNQLLAKRHEMANLLGYKNWADYVSEDKMVKTSENIEAFIEKLDAVTRTKAQVEYNELLELKKKDVPAATKVDGWESEYYEEKLKNEKFVFDSQLVRPYFEYNRVKEGIMSTISQMFSLTFKKLVDTETWHEDVEVYDVFESGEKIGTIYLDMHPRENKYKHAAQFSLKNGVKGYQLPEGVLVCNFTDPKTAENGVALLDHGEVTTFFHEFGHLIHYILSGKHTWERLSGIAVEWDFVEAPSQFLEEWAWEVDVLQKFALHYQTNEPIPSELVAKMRAADEFGKALFVKQQIFYSALSLLYYNQDPTNIDTTLLLQDIQKRYAMYEYGEGTHMQTSFGHIDGYSAIYCTYMWSLVIAKDLLSPFVEKGMLSTDVSLHYRKSILEKGGTEDASILVQNFLGREYTFEAFKKWLER